MWYGIFILIFFDVNRCSKRYFAVAAKACSGSVRLTHGNAALIAHRQMVNVKMQVKRKSKSTQTNFMALLWLSASLSIVAQLLFIIRRQFQSYLASSSPRLLCLFPPLSPSVSFISLFCLTISPVVFYRFTFRGDLRIPESQPAPARLPPSINDLLYRNGTSSTVLYWRPLRSLSPSSPFPGAWQRQGADVNPRPTLPLKLRPQRTSRRWPNHDHGCHQKANA